MPTSYRLLQAEDRIGAELSADRLVELYRHPDPGDRAWVRTNFVCTLDGAAHGADGRTGSINTASDRQAFALQRALADVVLVGAGTVRTEHYRAVDLRAELQDLRRREGLTALPTLAVVTRTGRLRTDLAGAVDGRSGGPVLIVVVRRPDEPSIEVAIPGTETIPLVSDDAGAGMIIDALARRGLRRVLCEGGPRLNQTLHEADLVDDICLTLSPLIVGGTAARSTSGADLRQSYRLGHVISADDDALLLRYLRDGRDPR